VGGADVAGSYATPDRVIPRFGQPTEYSVQPAVFPAEGGDVLHDNPVDCTNQLIIRSDLLMGGLPTVWWRLLFVTNVEPRPGRDVAGLRLPVVGRVVATDEVGLPYIVVDAAGGQVEPISEFVREMSAGDMPDSSCRSYVFDLLRWWRFLAAVSVEWDRAQRLDVRDLVLWLRQAPNPQRVRTRPAAPAAGSVNPRTSKPYLAKGYAPRTINHQLAVLSHFYDFHLGAGRGPLINPVPTAIRGGTRPGAHGNPLLEFAPHRRGAYRQKVPDQMPRVVSDELWNELFASMTSHRDRAILATYISSAARAAELLGMCCGDLDFGRQTISVIGKGTRTRQTVPASPDAFVWIRLYLAEGHVAPSDEPLPAAAPLWVTLRGPRRPLNYSAMRAVLNRANDKLGANITLHDLRHTCAARMMADPNMAITDVQAVLRHKSLATTGKYGTVALDELINRTLEHHARRAAPPPPRPHPAYDATDLAVLFGQQGG
jgi:integrase